VTRRIRLLRGIVLLAGAAGLAATLLTAQAAAPTITVSPDTGTAGTSVTVTGAGFPPGQVVALFIDFPSPFLGQPGPTADAQGGFHLTITWPDKSYDATGRVKPTSVGIHSVCGSTSYPGSKQTSTAQACAVFVVQAGASTSASPSPSPAPSPLVGPSPLTVGIVVGILLVLAAITALLMRQAKN
jgi:hypothetical protein